MLTVAVGVYLVYVIYQLFRFNLSDMLEVIDVSLSQHWTLEQIFSELDFISDYQKKWQLVYDDLILSGFFSISFGRYFILPKILLDCLRSFELRGEHWGDISD